MFVFAILLYRQRSTRSRTTAPKFIITRLRQINNEASSSGWAERFSQKRRIDDGVYIYDSAVSNERQRFAYNRHTDYLEGDYAMPSPL